MIAFGRKREWVRHGHAAWRRTLVLLATCLSGACTDATLGLIPPPPVPAANDLLGANGSFCTEVPSDTQFPVKILFLIDLSGSMCYSDPASGMCTPAECDQGPNNPLTNPSPPKRAQAVQAVINKFQGNPAVSFAVLTFSSSVNAYPYDITNPQVVFTQDVNQLDLDALRDVDNVTDDQGALSRVQTLLSTDMAQAAAKDPSELPRTKYSILFLTDGTPFPTCSAADPSMNQPPDSTDCNTEPSTCTVCQLGGSPTLFPNLMAGQDYNTTYQLVQIVDGIHALAKAYNVGELKFNAALLRVPNAYECCPLCFASDPTGSQSTALLEALAQPQANLGSFVTFTSANDISFLNYDFTSLEEPFSARTVIIDNRNTVITSSGLEVDSDGDGLSDTDEFMLGTNALNADTDGDGYSDYFEVTRGAPFDPLIPQVGRCAAHSPLCSNGVLCDTDGDGLKDCEEWELGTNPELVDSDADGVPDGVEFRRGMNPLVNDTQADPDFDGISNIDEIMDGTSVTEFDAKRIEPWSFNLSVEPSSTTDAGSNCYSVTESDLILPSPQSREPEGEPIGWSDTYVWVTEAPTGDLTDYGRIRVGCIREQYVPPTVRVPLDPTITFADSNLYDPSVFDPDKDCIGAMP